MDPSEKADSWESLLRARDLAQELASGTCKRPRASGPTPQEAVGMVAAAAEVEAAVAAAAAACKRPRASGPTTEYTSSLSSFPSPECAAQGPRDAARDEIFYAGSPLTLTIAHHIAPI